MHEKAEVSTEDGLTHAHTQADTPAKGLHERPLAFEIDAGRVTLDCAVGLCSEPVARMPRSSARLAPRPTRANRPVIPRPRDDRCRAPCPPPPPPQKKRREKEDKLSKESAEKERIRLAIEEDKAERKLRTELTQVLHGILLCCLGPTRDPKGSTGSAWTRYDSPSLVICC